MHLNLTVQGVQGVEPPDRGLKVTFKAEWNGEPVFLLGLDGEASFSRRTITRQFAISNGWGVDSNYTSPTISKGSERFITLIFSLSSEAVRHIENHRATDDVALQCRLHFRLQSYVAKERPDGQKSVTAGEVVWVTSDVPVVIPRSDWLKRLKEMEWQEWELIEIPKLALVGAKNLEEALRLVSQAQDALRLSDYKGVLAKCREAIESAGKYEGQGNPKKGWEAIEEQCWPDEQPKQEAFNQLIMGLSEVLHGGRHAQYPAINVSRSEAEFAFITTSALFSMIGRRKAGKETV